MELRECNEPTGSCVSCKRKEEVNNASFCRSNCKLRLCSDCKHYHKLRKIADSHQTTPMEEVAINGHFKLKYTPFCSCNRDHAVNSFCTDHNQMFCGFCRVTIHHYCKNVRFLEHREEIFIDEKTTANLVKNVREIKKNLQQLKPQRKIKASTFLTDIDKYIKDTDDLCNGIKQQIETFQIQFRTSANELRENILSKQEVIRENILRFSMNVDSSDNILRVFSEYGTQEQNFVAYQTVISQLNLQYARLTTELRDEDLVVKFDVDDVYKKLNELSASLDNINMSSTFSANTLRIIESLGDKLNNLTITTGETHASKFTTKDPMTCDFRYIASVTRQEVKGTWFTGGTSLANGNFVMADNTNCRLVEFDTSHKMVKEHELDGEPRDVTSVGDDVYVSVYKGRQQITYIYKCRLEGELSNYTKIKVPINTWSIAVSDDGKFIVDTYYAVQVLSQSGKLLHRIRKSCCDFHPLAVSQTHPAMFYYGDGNDIICRTLQDYKKQNTLRCEKMKGPRGICVDHKDNLYVCCFDSQNIHYISPDGQNGRVILEKLHGFTKPQSVLYNPYADEIVITSCDADILFDVYSLA